MQTHPYARLVITSRPFGCLGGGMLSLALLCLATPGTTLLIPLACLLLPTVSFVHPTPPHPGQEELGAGVAVYFEPGP